MAKFLTPDEERALVVLAQAGDANAKARLVLSIQRLIWRKAYEIARSYPWNDPEDLAQIGALAVCKGLKRFKPALGYRLSTYVMQGATRDMLRAARDNGIVNPTAQPSVLSCKARKQLDRHFGRVESLNVARESPDGELMELAAVIAAPPQEDAENECVKICRAVRECLQQLHERERRLVTLKYLHDMTLEGIAVGEGLTRERIRQLIAKAKPRLAKILLAHPVIRDYIAEKCA